jgi:hypothetical protein
MIGSQKHRSNAFFSVVSGFFTRSGRHLHIALTLVGLVLVCSGCLGPFDAPTAQTNQVTETQQTTASSSFPAFNALTPSITPSKPSSTNATPSPHGETFSSSGVKKTTAFVAPRNWKIIWSCDLSTHHNTDYDVIIHANTTGNTLLHKGLETTCSKNNTHGLISMNQAGKIYLVVLSEGGWTVQVQY